MDYQFGRPGRRALYTIEATPGGLLFTLDADDADGGEDAGTLVLQREDERTIESLLKRGGKVVDRWTRELLPDGATMRITQHGFNSAGVALGNTGYYRRVTSRKSCSDTAGR